MRSIRNQIQFSSGFRFFGTLLTIALSGLVFSFGHISDTTELERTDRVAFEVVGTLRECALFPNPAKPENHISSFVCDIDGDRWSITTTAGADNPIEKHLVGTNVYYLKEVSDRYALASDATNFYAVNHADFSPALLADGISPKHQNDTASIGSGNVPFGLNNSVLALWYAFASHNYLKGRTEGGISPLHYITREDIQQSKTQVWAKWKVLAQPPGLPLIIETTNHHATQVQSGRNTVLKPPEGVQAVFRVLGSTNYAQLAVPTSIRVDYFSKPPKADLESFRKTKQVAALITE